MVARRQRCRLVVTSPACCALCNSTPDPPGGAIDRVRDTRSRSAGADTHGEPSGVLRESALSPVWRVAVRDDAFTADITRGLRHCLDRGLTAVHTNDAGRWATYKVR